MFMLFLMCVTSLGANTPASADASCQTSDASFTASAKPNAGRYVAYARFGKSAQQDTATLIGTSLAGSCILEGSTVVNGTSWTPIATFDASGDTVSFELQSPLLANLPDANRPLVMLVSQNNPACVSVDTECRAIVADNSATIQSPDIAEEYSALRVLVPQITDTLNISRVNYYADDTLMYSTPRLETFDARMIPYYATHTSRVIVYGNNQQATLSETLPYSHSDGPSQFIFRLWRQHEGAITALGIALGILLLQQLTKLVIYLIYRKRQWRAAHGFLRDHLATFATVKEKRIAATKFIIQKTFAITEKVLLAGVVIGLLVFGTLTFVMKITRVDGESMHPTLNNTQLVYVNLMPVSIAHLNHTAYIPQRGELVAVHPLFGTVVATESTDELIVKRVIGLPGERVVVKNSVITVYNTVHPEGYNPDVTTSHPYTVTNDTVSPIDIDVTLANDEIFICGDNRPVSIDSRDNGAIRVSQVIGRVQGFPFGIQ